MRWKPHSKHQSYHRGSKHSQHWVFLDSEVSPPGIAEKKLVNFCTRQYLWARQSINFVSKKVSCTLCNILFQSSMIFTLFHALHLRDSPVYQMIYDDLTNHDGEHFIANGGLPAGKADDWVTIQILCFPIQVLKSTTTKCSHESWYSCFIFYYLVNRTQAA